MISFFPDVNVWLALADPGHAQADQTWQWLHGLPPGHRFIFSRFTQLGLLRLLTNSSVMGDRVLTLGRAWSAYDRWIAHPGVEFYPESHDIEVALRRLTQLLADLSASKALGDCYHLACASEFGATLVTLDRGLCAFARKQGFAVVNPAA